MNIETEEKIDKDEQRSFNILGKPFLVCILSFPLILFFCLSILCAEKKIRINDLIRYPNTLLADHDRLQSYWRPSLNAYFLSRDVYIFERIILPFYISSETSKKIKRSPLVVLSEKLFREELAFYNLLEYYHVCFFVFILIDKFNDILFFFIVR